MTHSTIELDYAGKPPRLSRFALVAFVWSVLAACGFLLVLPALVGLVIGIAAGKHITRHPALSGKGFASAATTISLCAVCLGLLVNVLLPLMGRSCTMSTRSVCAANLRGITQSLVVYANDNNDHFPVVMYAPYSPALNNPRGSARFSDPDTVLASYYTPARPQAGSIAASVWMLSLRGQVAPKQFLCKDDPFAGGAASITDGDGRYYDNFQRGDQISYSFAYPWRADGTVGNWWQNTNDASLPLVADMTPLQGTGQPARNLTPSGAPADPRSWNSANHKGDGQNVGYADGHAEFARSPDIGHENDNIYTTSAIPSTGPARYGGVPASKASPGLTAGSPPYDIILLPVRDASSGGM